MATEHGSLLGKIKFPQRVLDRYSDLEVIGEGGMGLVYSCYDNKLNRQVALKVMRPRVAKLPKFAGRFRREARMLVKSSHPSVIELYDFDEEKDFIYFTMRFIEGVSLEQLLEEGSIELQTAVRYMKDIADALAHLQGLGIVHRDIKPANILIDNDRAVLTDFGFTRFLDKGVETIFTKTSEFVGTPLYMAPESLTDGEVSPQTDIYQYGVAFYETITGRMPHGATNIAAMVEFHSKGGQCEAPSKYNSAIDAQLDELVNKCLDPLPECRWKTATEISQRCASWLAAQSGSLGISISVDVCPNKDTQIVESVEVDSSAQKRNKPQWIFALAVLALFVLSIYLLSGKGAPKVLPIKYKVVSSAERATIHWTTTEGSKFSYQLFIKGKERPLLKASEGEKRNKHKLVFNKLSPNTAYSVAIVDDEIKSELSFSTKEISFSQKPLVLAHKGRLYFDCRTNLTSNLKLLLQDENKTSYDTKISPQFSGIAFSDLPNSRKTTFAWQLLFKDETIASGSLSGKVRPLPNPRKMWQRRGKNKFAWPLHIPLKQNENFVYVDRAADIVALSLNRDVTSGSTSLALKRSFHISPLSFVTLGKKSRRTGGLCKVDNERVLFTCCSYDRPTRVWCMNVQKRSKSWRQQSLDSKTDEKLLAGEFRYSTTKSHSPGPVGYLSKDFYLYPAITPESLHIVCHSLGKKAISWMANSEQANVRWLGTETPFKDSSLRKRHDYILKAFFHNGHFFSLSQGNRDADQMATSLLFAVPVKSEKPLQKELAARLFRDWFDGNNISIDGKNLWITAAKGLYCWYNAPFGKSELVYQCKKWQDKNAYLCGQSVKSSGSHFFLYYDVGGKRKSLNVGNLTVGVHLASWSKDAGFQVYNPRLYEASELRMPPGLVKSVVLSKGFLSGATTNAVFAIDRKTGRFGSWHPTGVNIAPTVDERHCLRAYLVDDNERALVLDRMGRSYLMPLELLVSEDGQQLQPKPCLSVSL